MNFAYFIQLEILPCIFIINIHPGKYLHNLPFNNLQTLYVGISLSNLTNGFFLVSHQYSSNILAIDFVIAGKTINILD